MYMLEKMPAGYQQPAPGCIPGKQAERLAAADVSRPGNEEGVGPLPPYRDTIHGITAQAGSSQEKCSAMIDFALDTERSEGKFPLDAIYEACVLRFRPIMMTIMAALLEGLPLALATGTGAELRRPVGLTIVGDLAPPSRKTTRSGFIVVRDR